MSRLDIASEIHRRAYCHWYDHDRAGHPRRAAGIHAAIEHFANEGG